MSGKTITATDIEIGKRIRVRRLELKMSQGDLGDALGVTFQQIQKYEKGANRVGSGRMVDIADALKTTVPALYGLDGKATSKPETLEMMATRDGSRLALAFNFITDDRDRKAIVRLAERFADVNSPGFAAMLQAAE